MFFCTKILVFQMLLVQDDIRVLVQRESSEVFMSREFWLCDQVHRPPAYQHSTPVLEGSVTGIHQLPNGQFGAKTIADGGQQNQYELDTNASLQTGTSSVQNVSGEIFAGECQGM
jgi:type II secretory pathway component PulC